MTDLVKEIGERSLIGLFEKLVDQGDIPFNDDAVALSISNQKTIVGKVDTFVSKTDAPPNMTPYQMGAKAVIMVLSDFASKGVQPQFTMAAISIPSDMKATDVVEIVRGIKETSNKADVKYLGGDTSEATDIVITIAAVGWANKKGIILRNGARVGDLICTTGLFGSTGAGLKIFLEKTSALETQIKKFHKTVYSPEARLKEGLLLSKFGKITSSIDSSDGLAWCLKELIRNNPKLGVIIKNLPIDTDALFFARKNKLSIEDLVLYTGEEYELIFTLSSKDINKLLIFLEKRKVKIHIIGEITSNNPGKIILKTENVVKEIDPKGYEHFK